MKKFAINILGFSILIVIFLSFLLLKYGGYLDYFYEKFTSPRQTSLILGDSRSMQGIQPRVINKELKNEYAFPIFNYSFTIAQIAYGEPYLNSIKKKINFNTKKGLFIVTVHPWLFAQRENDDFRKGIYSEQDSPPHNMKWVNMNPNFEYFFRNFKYFHFKSIVRRTSFLHKDGWLEESNLPKDSATLKNWTTQQIMMYGSFSKKWRPSYKRKEDFIKIIKFLNIHGRVILVRMPVNKEILIIENNFWKNFDKEMETIAKENNLKYINFSLANRYKTYDGNHIDKYGGVKFTKELCDSIKILK